MAATRVIRAEAFKAVAGFRDELIAGEEPELCLRLRELGWNIWRLDAEMTHHDAAITRFSQWWKRTVRSGYAYRKLLDCIEILNFESTRQRRSAPPFGVAFFRS